MLQESKVIADFWPDLDTPENSAFLLAEVQRTSFQRSHLVEKTMAPSTEFSEKLVGYRRQKQLTQQQLVEGCSALGLTITTSMISHLEHANRKPSSSGMVTTLAKAMDLSPSETALLLLAAGFSLPAESAAGELPDRFVRLKVSLNDPAVQETLLDSLAFPEVSVVDESLDKLVGAWYEQANLRRSLRQREWNHALARAAAIEESVHKLSAQLVAYLKDIQTLAFHHLGQPGMAENTVRQAMLNAKRSDDRAILAACAVHRGDILRNSVRMQESLEQYQEAENIFESIGDEKRLAWSRRKKATWYLFQGDWQTAMPTLEGCLQVFTRLMDNYELSHTRNSLGWAYDLRGDWQNAIREREVALALTLERNAQNPGNEDKYTLERCYLYLGDDLRQVGRTDEAEKYLRDALDLSHELEEMYERGRIYLCLAKLYRQKGQGFQIEALKHAEKSLAFHRDRGSKMRLAQSLIVTGQCYVDHGKDDMAVDLFDEAAELCGQEGAQIPFYLASALINKARLYCCQLKPESEFEKIVAQVRELCRTNNYPRYLARLNVILAEHAFVKEEIEHAVDYTIAAYGAADEFNTYIIIETHQSILKLVQSQVEARDVVLAREFTARLIPRLRTARRVDGRQWSAPEDGDVHGRYLEELEALNASLHKRVLSTPAASSWT